ncbi:MOP flippase family protein [Cohnella sp. CFH 77786]|uniref:MOP flippase family protein n=1 Tax=Cohnella sp. CFH 77786 TaxID=2662265 RepID=UPI001C6107C4|nr:MOP flippase family protein [Cohnella sp. CFH 77786]MBW5448373.1 MOP flippase family protein [Cohnella sp. CFH 77786]
MSLRVKGVTAVKWSSLATVVTTVVQLAQVVTVSRLLSPEDYGLISMIMVVVGIAVSMSDFGVSSAIVHRQNVTKSELSSLYVLNLAVGAAIGAIVWLIAPLVCAYYQEPRLLEPMRWMALLCVIPAVGQQFQVLFQKELRFEYLAKVDIAAVAIGFTAALAGAYAGYGVYALVGAYLSNALFKSLSLAAAGWRQWKPGRHFSIRDLKGYVSFGAYQTGSNLIQMLTSNIDYLILGRMIGAEGLGYYTFAYQLGIMPMQKLWPLVSQVSFPLLAKIQDRTDLLRQGYFQITGMISYVTGPIYLGLAVTAPYLVPFAFGEQWTASVPLVQILAVMFLLRSSLIPTESLLLAVGRANTRFHYSVLCMVIVAPCLLAGAWLHGAAGVAFGYLAAQAMIVIVNYYQSVRKVLAKCAGEYARSFMPGVLYSAVMAAGVFALGWLVRGAGSEWFTVAWQLTWGFILYAALIIAFKRELVLSLRNRLRMKASHRESSG